jgi:aldose 1-epimerase
MAAFEINHEEREGIAVVVLRDRDARLEATLAPAAGMVACSLRRDGVELLGQRRGLAKYVAEGSTMGVPLLHPWANRLRGWTYAAAGREVRLQADAPGVRADEHGLPIHGLLSGSPPWTVLDEQHGSGGARLEAELELGAHPERLRSFPFPHVVGVSAALEGGALTVQTTVRPTADVPVPISFGWHPYLRPPGERAAWVVRLPQRTRLALDEQGLPTGDADRLEAEEAPLGERTFDDHFAVGDDPVRFAAAGDGVALEVRFEAGYPFAQVFAPPDQDVVCFEPMTATVGALSTGAYDVVAPGERFAARFAVVVG